MVKPRYIISLAQQLDTQVRSHLLLPFNFVEKEYSLTQPPLPQGWTARVTTTLEYFQIPYKATYIRMTLVKNHSPSGLIPLLTPLSFSTTQNVQVNDSLSICEFLAESHPDLSLWPADPFLRALARSAVAEMHSGFSELRSVYHSTYVGRYTGNVPVSEKARKEVERLLVIWDSARKFSKERLGEKADGGFLFGRFSIADVFFWPVLWVCAPLSFSPLYFLRLLIVGMGKKWALMHNRD